MDYEKFKDQFNNDLKQELYERGAAKVDITVQRIEKMNESYDAITVMPEGSNVGVNLNVEKFFEAYENDVAYAKVIESAADTIEKGIQDSPSIDLAMLSDYDQMRDKLCMEVVSAERNADLLKRVPHQNIEDIAVVYRFVMENTEDGRATILVTNNLVERYGITPEQLHADALKNAPEIKPSVIKGMNEVMLEIMGPDAAEMFGMGEVPQDEMMYVATVPDKTQGAGVLAYQEFMEQAAERLGGDFFVLPSSVHEILLVKDDGNANYSDLKSMVEEVNATQVSPEEKLTDSVYHYDSKNHIFELGEKYIARQQEKETEVSEDKAEKGSVLKDLKDKQKKTEKKPSKDVKNVKEVEERANKKTKEGVAL